MRITDKTVLPGQVKYLRVTSVASGPRGAQAKRSLKGETSRKSWRCWEAQWDASSTAGISTSRKQVARAADGERSPAQAGWIHRGRSPADINLISARAVVRLAVRAAGSVGKRPTVMRVPQGACNPGWPERPGASGGESCWMNLTA